MKKSRLIRSLRAFSIPADEWVQAPNLKTLIFTTNQGLDYHQNFIYFDTENELIKIKEYKARAINGQINDFQLMGDKRTLVSFYSITATHPIYKFRSPKVGDTVFSINKNTKALTYKGTITVVGSLKNFIKLDKDLDFDSVNEILLYAENIESVENSIQDPKDKALFLVYTPVSNYPFDICVSTQYLVGMKTKDIV